MPRTKNYKAEHFRSPYSYSTIQQSDTLIELPPNPKNHRVIDLSPWLGKGFDEWVCAFASVIRAMLSSGNFTPASIASLNANGIKSFMLFLIDGPLHFPPKKPSGLSTIDLKHYIRRLKLKYPNGSTAKNCYAALKSLLIGMIDYGFIQTDEKMLLPSNPFPKNEITLSGEKPLTHTEMQRLASALKADLIAVHHNKFDGPDSEAIAVLMLIVAMRTGINATPLMEMKRDCLQPHPFMPNLMLLQTIKRRGKGAQSQSIRQTALHDTQTAIRMDGVAVLRKAIEITDALTRNTPDDLKDRVWLYRLGQRGFSHEITCLNPGTAASAIRAIVKRHALLADDGAPLKVNLAKLRKTMENRLWKLTDGDLPVVASIMGHSPHIADNHYLQLDEESKAEGAKFIGTAFTEKLRGINLTPTPSGNCKDSLHGTLAPKDGETHCEQFTHCLGCPSYAIVGTQNDLYRLFSFQVFLMREIDYYPSDEWAEWRAHHLNLIELIDQFTAENFEPEIVKNAKASAHAKPHPFWAVKIRQSFAANRGTHES